jgi:hypothetical protein
VTASREDYHFTVVKEKNITLSVSMVRHLNAFSTRINWLKPTNIISLRCDASSTVFSAHYLNRQYQNNDSSRRVAGPASSLSPGEARCLLVFHNNAKKVNNFGESTSGNPLD